MAKREERQAVCRSQDQPVLPASHNKAATVSYGDDRRFRFMAASDCVQFGFIYSFRVTHGRSWGRISFHWSTRIWSRRAGMDLRLNIPGWTAWRAFNQSSSWRSESPAAASFAFRARSATACGEGAASVLWPAWLRSLFGSLNWAFR